jgi:hypothetical protein
MIHHIDSPSTRWRKLKAMGNSMVLYDVVSFDLNCYIQCGLLLFRYTN